MCVGMAGVGMLGLGLSLLLLAALQTVGIQAQTTSNFIFNPVANVVRRKVFVFKSNYFYNNILELKDTLWRTVHYL